MAHEEFLEILTATEPSVTKRQVIGGHKFILTAERLTLTLRFLATGETFRLLSFQFRNSRSAISYTVREVCQAILKSPGRKIELEDRVRFPLLSSSSSRLAILVAILKNRADSSCISLAYNNE